MLGLGLNLIRPNLGLIGSVPWGEYARQTALMYLASLLLLAVQSWLALRSQSFALSSGIGIAGTLLALILSFSLAGKTLVAFFPWAMPAAAVPTPPYAAMEPSVVIGVSVVGAIIVSILGCLELTGRDVL